MPYYPPPNLTPQFASTGTLAITGTTEQSIIPSGVGQKLIPGGWFGPGNNARIVARGDLTSILLASLTLRVKLGGATILTASLGSLLGPVAAAGWSTVLNLQCTQAGQNGKINTGGQAQYPSSLGSQAIGKADLNLRDLAIDTTVDQLLDITAQWGAAGSTLNTNIFTLELMKVS